MIKKVFPDIEKVKSMMGLIEDREKSIKLLGKKFPTIVVETYYEIIKELTMSLLLTNGLKYVGENAHKESISHLIKYNFLENEITLVQDLRKKRNKSMYEGKQIEETYLENKEKELKKIILKLKSSLCKKIDF